MVPRRSLGSKIRDRRLSISYLGGQSSLPMSLTFPNRLRQRWTLPTTRRGHTAVQAMLAEPGEAAVEPCRGRAPPRTTPPCGRETARRRCPTPTSTTAFARQPIADDDAGAAIPLFEKFQIEREPIVGRAHAEDGEAAVMRRRSRHRWRSETARTERRRTFDHSVNGHGARQHQPSTRWPAAETAGTTTRQRACRRNR